MEIRNDRPAKLRLRLVMAAAVAAAAMLCAALVHDAIAPAEARPARAKEHAVQVPVVGALVRIEALGTQRAGVTGRPLVNDEHPVAVGETLTRLLIAGERATPTVCKAEFFGPSTDNDHLFLWRIDVKVVEVFADRTTIQVHWIRTLDADGRPEVQKDEVRTFTLGPTDSHVLDYVENQQASSPCASLLVRISAQPIAPKSQRAVIADVWTVDENAAGQMRSVYQRIQGVTGQPIPFQFQPLDFLPSGGGPPGGGPVKMDVGGTFQAAVSEDGFVDVSLSATRRTSWGGADSHGEGRVQFRTAIGETAALILPQPAGRLAPDAATAGIDLGRTFTGHRMWLYVKVESVR
jgi:hypothetical protein